jgi:hypothetical protein
MVKRQRWRNPAMTCGSWPSASRDLASLARRSGDVAGDLGGDFRGIERMGIEPDAAEALADFRAVEVRQGDAVRDGIGEAFVLAAGAGELGVEVDGVADIADDEEGRAALIGGQGGDVAAALVVGAFKGFVEGEGAAFAVAGLGGGGFGDVRRGGDGRRDLAEVPCLVSLTKWRAL